MKKIKKIICVALSVASVMSSVVLAEGDGKFSDTKEHWAKDVIEKYSSNGYINGYPDGTFKPDNGVSVAEFCRIVSAIKGINYKITESNWALPYIREMIGIGVIERNDFDDFNVRMTREQVAKAVIPLMTGEYYPKDIEQFTKYITDADNISKEYKEVVLKTYVSGVLSGYEDGSWGPKRGVTRAEILSILDRVFNKDMREVPAALQGASTESPFQSYYYSAAVQVRSNTSASAMQYRLYGSDAVYMTEDDASTGLKMVNEIQGAQGFGMVLRYDVSKIKEKRDSLEKLYVDAQWVKNGSKEHDLGLWYYTYDTDKTDWNNNLYFKNLNGSAVAGDDTAGYNSVISNIKSILPTWGNASMAVENSEKTPPIAKSFRDADGKYMFDLTEIADEVIAKADENNMVEFVLTSVNYDGIGLDDDKPQIYIAGEKAPKLNAEYRASGGIEYENVTLNLKPADAILDGGMIRTEMTDGIENIAFFVTGQTITFKFDAPFEGDYLMKLNMSASDSAGGIVGFDINGEYFEKEFPYGKGWAVYDFADVKTVHLKKGENTLTIKDVKLNATYLINIRDVVFEMQ